MAVPLGRTAPDPNVTSTTKGGIGGAVSDLFGSTNNYSANAPTVDPNAYQYGGQAGGAQQAADRYRSQAEGAQNRQGVQADFSQANSARGSQASLAAAMQARASGQMPSIAQMQADRQMQQAAAGQASASASARGAGGIAMAQQNAANNTANSQAAISGQAQINAANERMQAEQAAFGAYGNMRGQDANQAQFQAQLSDAQRGRNDAMTMGMTQNEMGVQNSQLGAQQNQQAQQSSNQLGAQSINASIAGQNAQMNQQNGQGVMGMFQSAAGALLADGGPMKAGAPKPYLVGERGPELVVPKQDGFVIPAELTKKMAPRAEGGSVKGAGDIATSTWGVGKGVSNSQAKEDYWKRDAELGAFEAKQANDRRLGADRDARLAQSSGAGGGMAIAGGPGTGTTLDEPLRRADQETVSSARAREAEGIELTPEEERKRAGAEYRSGNAKKADRKPSLSEHFKQGGNDWQQRAATVDTSYRGPTSGVIPPHLIQIAGPRAMGGPIMGIGDQPKAGDYGGWLNSVHHEQSMGELNQSSFKPPSAAKGQMLADGGPMDGSGEVVPLYSPPGKWLQSTPEGRAYYIDEPKQLDERIEPTRPSLAKAMAPQPKESPIAARAPVELPPEQTKQKKMSDDELMAWANRLQGDMQSQYDQRMAQGPSVSLASRMRAR